VECARRGVLVLVVVVVVVRGGEGKGREVIGSMR
jgi:hypothetical protein